MATSHAADVLEYRKARDGFYARFSALWPGTLADPYDLLELYALPRLEIEAITQAAEGIEEIYNQTAALLSTVPDEALRQMGLPKLTFDVARTRIPGMADTIMGRMDLVKTSDGYKMLEFNADTPGLLVETFAVNAKMCEQSGKIDPNRCGKSALAASLASAVQAGLEYVGKTDQEEAQIVFTSCGEHVRDRGIAEYLMSLVDFPDTIRKRYLPIEVLRIDEDGLYSPDGDSVDVLYRVYPLQFFQHWTIPSKVGASTVIHAGEVFFQLLRRHKLALINPPSAFLLESKAVQAVIWGLYEADRFFDTRQRSLIEKYMLPTYMDPVFREKQYVVKPVYGGQGDTVTIVAPQKNEILKSFGSTYADQIMVYQEYVEIPQMEAMTEDGPRLLSILTSCFLISGQAMGIVLRAGRGITDESWWFVPVCMAD